MIRTFHPIGQGAFYTEEFNNFTAVYDCGSETDLPLLHHEIRETFSAHQHINALFISHFDNDHINGLEYLLNYCRVEPYFPHILKVVFV